MKQINESNDNQSQLSQRSKKYESTSSLLTNEEYGGLYEGLMNSVRNGFETKQQQDQVVKETVEKIKIAMRRNMHCSPTGDKQ